MEGAPTEELSVKEIYRRDAIYEEVVSYIGYMGI